MATKNHKISSTYSTSDISLAVVISLSHPIKEISRQNPRRVEFLFIRSKNLDELIKNYWKGNLKVEPQQFFNQLRIVKSRLYGGE